MTRACRAYRGRERDYAREDERDDPGPVWRWCGWFGKRRVQTVKTRGLWL